ncbi:MAG: cyclic nucleotide-binding domain-containing protein, partial [Pseudomonadota bacterium]
MEKERREHAREILSKPEIGMVYPLEEKPGPMDARGGASDSIAVEVQNRSREGVLLESPLELTKGAFLDFWVRPTGDQCWQGFRGEVVWGQKEPAKEMTFILGIKLLTALPSPDGPGSHEEPPFKKTLPGDLGFLLRTSLLDSIPREARCPLLNCMVPGTLGAGERLIKQGDRGDRFFVIQEGDCVIHVEKEGEVHPISRLGPGDIV